jgi:hypothetical protein
MKKTQAIFGAGALLLAIAVFFAGKANSKAIAAHLFVSTTAGGCLQINASSVAKFTTIGVFQAAIITDNCGSLKLWATSACGGTGAKAVYFKG